MLVKSTKFNYVLTKEHWSALEDNCFYLQCEVVEEVDNAFGEYLLSLDGNEEVLETL
jgi:2,3-bisphosphoglycerate-independent phosphoglycerate mutase